MIGQRISVTAVEQCFIGGQRRKPGDRFSIEVEDYTDYEGKLRVPVCLERDEKIAARRIAEIASRPVAAALASAGKGAEVKADGKVIRASERFQRNQAAEVFP